MMPFAVTGWMFFAAVGGGLALLRATGLLSLLSQGERCAIGFVLGFGIIGWLAFFAGLFHHFSAPAFIAILILLSLGLVFIRSPAQQQASCKPTSLEWILIFGIVIVALMDFTEALAPAADADSMAYHFETPRRFLAEHKIYAIPRALDGVTQLLLQLTYGVAMGLGGKTAVTLWAMISGWGLGAVFYVIARHHIDRQWALAGTLILMTTPAVIYSAGTGQVEVRLAAFALIAAYAAALSVKERNIPGQSYRWAIIAGLAAGFYADSKATGLIFAFVTCIVLAGGRKTVQRMAVFSLAAAITGIQWYAFNWHATGDPIFPLLWRHVDLLPGYPWNEDVAAALRNTWKAEKPELNTFTWFFMYPIRTIIAPLRSFESLRTGVGPAVLMLLPFAAIALTLSRDVFNSLLFRLLCISVLFYTLWYFFGPSLRVRHLFPAYPLVLLCVVAGASRYAENRSDAKRVIAAGIAVMLVFQIAGQVVFSKRFVEYLTSKATPGDFLETNITGYNVVHWLNEHLSPSDRVFILNREWPYLLNVPYFYAHISDQTVISLYPGATDTNRFIVELTAQGITHIVITKSAYGGQTPDTPGQLLRSLAPSACLEQVIELRSVATGSRTLPELVKSNQSFLIFAIKPSACPLS